MTSPFRLRASPVHQQYGVTVLRVIAGVVFCAHGAQKWFTMGMPAVTDMFAKMGIPLPGLSAPLIATLELAGGIALIIGLLTRLAGLGLAADMLGAVLLVKLSGGLTGPRGYEFELVLFAASLAIALAGPGALSVDAMLGRKEISDAA